MLIRRLEAVINAMIEAIISTALTRMDMEHSPFRSVIVLYNIERYKDSRHENNRAHPFRARFFIPADSFR
jgi:hypothetical protein